MAKWATNSGDAPSRAARRTRSGNPGEIRAAACSRSLVHARSSDLIAVVVYSQLFAGAVEARLDGRHARPEGLGDLGMAAALLHEREERAVARPKLGERVSESVELLRVHGPRRLGHILVLGRERDEDPAQLLAPQVVDAGVAREPEKPGLELLGRLEPRNGAGHLDEHHLRQVLDGVAPARDGVCEARDTVLVRHDELAHRDLVSALRPAYPVAQ